MKKTVSQFSIIVKGTNWIGDVFLSLPAVYSLRHLFPDARIDIALKRPLGELVSGVEAIDEVIEYDGTLSGEIDLVRRLRGRRYNLGVIFPRSIHSASLIFLSGARERLGYRADLRSFLLTKGVNRTSEIRKKHQSEYYRHLVSHLGDAGPFVIPRILPTETEDDWAQTFLRGNGYRGGPLFGLNPGAAYGGAKRWRPERFGMAADAMIDEFGGSAVIFGGGGDRATADEVLLSMRHPAILAAGRTTIRQLIALISKTSIFITNDTGPMHIASAVGIPIVAIFGSTNPLTTSPMGVSSIIRHPLPCSPCLKRACPEGHKDCMELITAQDVVLGARELYVSKPGVKK